MSLSQLMSRDVPPLLLLLLLSELLDRPLDTASDSGRTTRISGRDSLILNLFV
jgi:hypothetical protein